MGRPSTRTETINIHLLHQLEDYLHAEQLNLVGFNNRFLPDMSPATFRNAVKGDASTSEVLEAIDAALTTAQREQIRRDRKTCPHCHHSLD